MIENERGQIYFHYLLYVFFYVLCVCVPYNDKLKLRFLEPRVYTMLREKLFS